MFLQVFQMQFLFPFIHISGQLILVLFCCFFLTIVFSYYRSYYFHCSWFGHSRNVDWCLGHHQRNPHRAQRKAVNDGGAKPTTFSTLTPFSAKKHSSLQQSSQVFLLFLPQQYFASRPFRKTRTSPRILVSPSCQ